MVGASGTDAKAVRPETAVALTRVIPPAALKKFRRETDMLFSPFIARQRRVSQRQALIRHLGLPRQSRHGP